MDYSGIVVYGSWIEPTAFPLWSSVELSRSMLDFTNAFSLSVSLPLGQAPAELDAGNQVRIEYQGETAMMGFVEKAQRIGTPENMTVSITGRSSTSILVDSSCRLTGQVMDYASRGLFSHTSSFQAPKKLEDIAAILCAPFHIDVEVENGLNTGPVIPRLNIQAGQTVYEVLDKLLQQRGLVAYSMARGSLRISKYHSQTPFAGRVDTFLNINVSRDLSNVYPFLYVVNNKKKNVLGYDIDESWPWESAPRTLVLVKDTAVDEVSADILASNEVTARQGEASEIEVTVSGWGTYTPAGRLVPWSPNTLVDLHAPVYGVDDLYLIVRVVSRFSVEGGHTTTLTLRDPRAFARQERGFSVTPPFGEKAEDWAKQVSEDPVVQTLVKDVKRVRAAVARGLPLPTPSPMPEEIAKKKTVKKQYSTGKTEKEILEEVVAETEKQWKEAGVMETVESMENNPLILAAKGTYGYYKITGHFITLVLSPLDGYQPMENLSTDLDFMQIKDESLTLKSLTGGNPPALLLESFRNASGAVGMYTPAGSVPEPGYKSEPGSNTSWDPSKYKPVEVSR